MPGGAAANAAAEAGASVLVVSKDPIGCSDTKISEGIITVRGSGEDSDTEEVLAENLRVAGDNLNDPAITEAFAEDTEAAYDWLRRQGLRPTIDDAKGTAKTLPIALGGHTHRRSIGHRNGGIAFGHAAWNAIIEGAGVDYLEDAWFLDAITLDDDGDGGPEVVGALIYDAARGRFVAVRTQAVVIASGGLNTLFFPKTDGMRGNTGDSFAVAARAGADLIDMEQLQFLPFCITYPPAYEGLLAGEPATAGFLGVLRDAHGKLILDGVMLRTRAECSAAIVRAVADGKGTARGGCYLDLTANVKAPRSGPYFETFLFNALPRVMATVRQAMGKKAAKCQESWEVRPGAHYMMGGVRVDADCVATTDDGRAPVRGLFAAGQAMGGLFGSNRLGSTSLSEGAIFGRRLVRGPHGGDRAHPRRLREPAWPNRRRKPFDADPRTAKRMLGADRPGAHPRWLGDHARAARFVARPRRAGDDFQRRLVEPNLHRSYRAHQHARCGGGSDTGLSRSQGESGRPCSARRAAGVAAVRQATFGGDPARRGRGLAGWSRRPSAYADAPVAYLPLSRSVAKGEAADDPAAAAHAAGPDSRAALHRHHGTARGARGGDRRRLRVKVKLILNRDGVAETIAFEYVPREDGERPMALDVLLQAQDTEIRDLSHRYGCRNRTCGLCTIDINGRPRVGCRSRVREGDTLSAQATLPVLRDMVVRRDGIARQMRGRLPDMVRGNDLDVPAPDDYHELTACIECYACLDGCPMHAGNFIDGADQRDEHDAYRWGNPFSLLKLQRIRLDPVATAQQKDDALEVARDLGLDACRDCPGCKCGVGIDLKHKVVGALLDAAG